MGRVPNVGGDDGFDALCIQLEPLHLGCTANFVMLCALVMPSTAPSSSMGVVWSSAAIVDDFRCLREPDEPFDFLDVMGMQPEFE